MKRLHVLKQNKIATILFVVVLFVLGVILLIGAQKNTETRQFAQTPISYPQPTSYPSSPELWATRYTRLGATSFTLRIGSQSFYGKGPAYVHSDPSPNGQTLEVQWLENNTLLSLNLYFRMIPNNMWELYNVGVIKGNSNWTMYKDASGNTISSLINYHYYASQIRFIPTDGTDAEIICNSCEIEAFKPQPQIVFSSGYSLEALLGLPAGKIIDFMPMPNATYGVNVLLRDASGNNVPPPSGMYFVWSSDSPNIATVSNPANQTNGQIAGLSYGVAQINVRAMMNNRVVAATSFPVRLSDTGDQGAILNFNHPSCTIGSYLDNPANVPPNYTLTTKITAVSPGQQFVVATNFYNNANKQYEKAKNSVTLGDYLQFVDSNGSNCAVDPTGKVISCDHGAFVNGGATSMAFRVKYIGATTAPVSVFGTTFTSNGDTGSCSTTLNAISTLP